MTTGSFDTSAWLGTLVWAAVALTAVLLLTFALAKIVGRFNVVDAVWGLLFVTVAVVVFVRSAGHGDDVRRWLLLGLTVVWGGRLAVHVGRRSIGKGEDPRYVEFLDRSTLPRDLAALLTIFLLQGVLAFLISAPLLVGGFEAAPVGPLAWIGVALWAVGLFFETTGDNQMEAFKRDPANKGRLIDTGLWRYTRHPNYFGDACVWWGLFLVAADALPGVATIFGPLIMTYLLVFGSGARLLERSMSTRAGWDAYAERTSMFVPLPPRWKQALSRGQA